MMLGKETIFANIETVIQGKSANFIATTLQESVVDMLCFNKLVSA